MEKIKIDTDFIKLQQLLKLAGFVNQGSDVKILISKNLVFLNKVPVIERGKKVYCGDVVEVKGIGSIEIEK